MTEIEIKTLVAPLTDIQYRMQQTKKTHTPLDMCREQYYKYMTMFDRKVIYNKMSRESP